MRAELAQLHHANSGIDYEVQYSTVSISLDEVVSYAASRTGFGERLKDAFGGSGRVFLDVLQEIVIAIIYLLPFAIVIAVIVIIVRRIRKRHGKGKKNDGNLPHGGQPTEPVNYGGQPMHQANDGNQLNTAESYGGQPDKAKEQGNQPESPQEQ